MPAAYAHITLVNLLRESSRLERIPNFPTEAISAVLDYLKFCELGAISPDYPYLALGDHGAKRWADLMHYEGTVQMIRAGVRELQRRGGEPQRKGLAWLLGYAAHVATDMAVHPVVQLKVGPYAENQTAHRKCEMHQDAYIFPQRLNLGEIGLSEHLKTGIGACGSPGDESRLDPDVAALWEAMCQKVHPVECAANPPDFHRWRHGFKRIVDQIAEEGDKLLPLARHVAAGEGLMYPAFADIDLEFIQALRVPGGTWDYDRVFDRAIEKVGTVWRMVAQGVLAGEMTELTALGNWDLDTGLDETDRLVFWS